jgi:HlyD family secretion protein
VSSAQSSLDKTSSQLSLAKQQAEIALEAAANTVRNAQDSLAAVATSAVLNPDGTINPDADQSLINKYNTALRAEQDAEGNMRKAQLALDDARKQEIDGVAAAQATLADAQKQLADTMAPPTKTDLDQAQAALDQANNNLQKTLAGPTKTDLDQAQAAVDQAKNNLVKAQAGATQADLVAAQSTLDQAKNALAKLKAPPTQTDIDQAQASVDQAVANLNKVKAGPTQSDLVAAQTAVDQAKNNLDALKAGSTASDIAGAQASVDQATTSLKSAQLKLEGATLKAPFGGVVADIPISVGQQVGTSTAAVNLVDTSAYHVDMNIGESDISRIKIGQDVNLTFDALAGEVFTGTVTYVAPKATIASGVVSYLATATLDPKAVNSAIKPGMTTTASAIVDRRTNVLMVPNRAIRTQGRNRVINVLSGNTQVPITVQAGLSNDTFTEIVSCVDAGKQCLAEGDAVVIPTTGSTTAAPAGGIFNFGGAGRAGGR